MKRRERGYGGLIISTSMGREREKRESMAWEDLANCHTMRCDLAVPSVRLYLAGLSQSRDLVHLNTIHVRGLIKAGQLGQNA